jgi:hypothetical protein
VATQRFLLRNTLTAQLYQGILSESY